MLLTYEARSCTYPRSNSLKKLRISKRKISSAREQTWDPLGLGATSGYGCFESTSSWSILRYSLRIFLLGEEKIQDTDMSLCFRS